MKMTKTIGRWMVLAWAAVFSTGALADSPWAGKKVAFLGDSITTPAQTNRPQRIFWQYLAEDLGLEPHLYAVSGYQWDRVYKAAKLMRDEMGSSVDAILVFAGTNDYMNGIPLGEWYDEVNEEVAIKGQKLMLPRRHFRKDMKTFKGRINTVMDFLKTNFPDQQIILMTPLHRGYANLGGTNIQPAESVPNALGRHFEEYIAALREAADIWSVPLIDLYRESGLYPMNAAYAKCFRSGGPKGTDNLHPNTEGHRRLAKTIAARLQTLPTDFKRPIPAVRYPGTSFDGIALAKAELKQHLARVANVVPYEFRFAKPVDAPPPQPFESRYRIDGRTVWFWGDDAGPDALWDWGDDRGRESQKHNGTLFAVELFAERELGIKWLWPGEDGVVAPCSEILRLPARAEGHSVSTLLKARIRNYEAYHPTTWEMVSNVLPRALFDAPPPSTFESRWLWQKRLRLQDQAFFTYGHAFTDWKMRFGKTHPEYLNLRAATGERGATDRYGPVTVKLCVSNDAVVDQIIADWCAAGTNRFLNVCENDNDNWCECARCRALDVPQEGESPYAHLTDRYVNFWNRIAAKARAIRSDVMLTTYIYSAYRYPPRREKIASPANMLFGFVCSETDDCLAMVKAWRAAGMTRFFFRPNYFHSTVTIHRGLERYFFNQFHDLLRLGMMGCDYDADANRPATAFEFYVMARALADPSVSFDAIAADYYAAYGAAAGEVKAYYEAVRKTGEAARAARQAAKIASPEMFRDRSDRLPDAQVYGRNSDELAVKKAMLDAALAKHEAAGDLSTDEYTRLRSLALQAEHGLLTYRFLRYAEKGSDNALYRSAYQLQEFRIANREILPDVYPHLYNHDWAEARYWRRYRQRLPDWSRMLVKVRSSIDSSEQPCHFWAPEKAKTTAVPLVVGLHTWSGDFTYLNHYATVFALAKKLGWAFVGPDFRGANDHYTGCGHDYAVQDIVDAVNYAKSRVRIDPARIYIIGGSGGGHMTLLMLGRRPDLFAAGAAFCPIADLARWHAESLENHPGRGKNYARMMESACGGSPAKKPKEYAQRSPLTWLERARAQGVPVYIGTGIHDGWRGSVPVGHAIRAFNALANAPDRLSEEEIDRIEKTQAVPPALAFTGKDPFYGESRRIHLRRTSANVRLTLFEGGHDMNYAAGIDFLARQRKGAKADWTLPAQGRSDIEKLNK